MGTGSHPRALGRAAVGAARLITIDTLRPGIGAGARLIERLAPVARATGASHITVWTSNDNLTALRFYQRVGFRLTDVRVGAHAKARQTIPWIPTRPGQPGRRGNGASASTSPKLTRGC